MPTIRQRVRAFINPERTELPATPVDFDEAQRIAEEIAARTGASAVHVDPETGHARYSLDGGRTWRIALTDEENAELDTL